jgi:hypothetical protein
VGRVDRRVLLDHVTAGVMARLDLALEQLNDRV